MGPARFLWQKIQNGDIVGHYGYHNDWTNMFVSARGINFKKVEEIINLQANKQPTLNFKERISSLSKSLAVGFMPLKIQGRQLLTPIRKLRGNPDYKLTFQPAGEKDKIKIPMMEIDRIIYGNRYNNEEWLFNQVGDIFA